MKAMEDQRQSEYDPEFISRLQDILEVDSIKNFFNILELFFKRKNLSLFSHFINNFSIFEKNQTIRMKKRFIYLNKLLVLRNILQTTSHGGKIFKSIYFFNWKRLIKFNDLKVVRIYNVFKNYFQKSEKISFKFQKILKRLILSFLKILYSRAGKEDNLLEYDKNEIHINNFMNFFRVVSSIVDNKKKYYFSFIKSEKRETENSKIDKITHNLKLIRINILQKLWNFTKNEKISFMIKQNQNENKNQSLIINLDEKSIFIRFNLLLILFKFSSINKIIFRNFNKWKTHTFFPSYKKRFQDIRDINDKLIKRMTSSLFNLVKNKVGILFQHFKNGIFLLNIKKYEITKFSKIVLSLENSYNHYLLKSTIGFGKLLTVIKRKQSKLVEISQRKGKTYSNSYFLLWRTKCCETKNFIKNKNKLFISDNLISVIERKIKYKIKSFSFLCIQNKFHTKLNAEKHIYRLLLFSLKNIFNKDLKNDKANFFNLLKYPMWINDCYYEKSITVERNSILDKIINKSMLLRFKHKFWNILKNNLGSKNMIKKFQNISNELPKFVESLSNKLIRNTNTKHFFLNLIKIKNSEINKKKNIGFYIISNLAVVNLSLSKEILKKTKLIKVLKLWRSIYKIRLRITNPFTNKFFILNSFFFKWRNDILLEKKLLIADIKSYEDINV
jgi:hypothetical protein